MPHVTDGSLKPDPKLNAVTPVTGVTFTTNGCSACYDGKGEALYVNVTGGNLNVYRTRNGYRSLAEVNNSCDFLTTVVDGCTFLSSGIQRINGKLYINHGGNRSGIGTGHWIWRDDSPDADGSGPWVLHSSIQNGTTAYDEMKPAVGEILVLPSGRWVTGTYTSTSGYGWLSPRFGVRTSDDGGVTWTTRINAGWYIVGGQYGYGWTRNFAYWDGYWYQGGWGNVDPGKHYKSSDGASWTDLGSLGTGNSTGWLFMKSTPEKFWLSWTGGNPMTLGPTVISPDQIDSSGDCYVDYDLGSRGLSTRVLLITNIGPDDDPYWVATNSSEVIALGSPGGWQVGQLAFG